MTTRISDLLRRTFRTDQILERLERIERSMHSDQTLERLERIEMRTNEALERLDRIERGHSDRGTLEILPGTPYSRYAIPVEYLPSRSFQPRWGYSQRPD